MSDDVTPYTNPDILITPVENIGRIANEVASRHTFDAYLARKATNTISRQTRDLALFAEYRVQCIFAQKCAIGIGFNKENVSKPCRKWV